MGVCQSQEEKALSHKTKQIDKELMQGHLAQQKVVKLLLLGECNDALIWSAAANCRVVAIA